MITVSAVYVAWFIAVVLILGIVLALNLRAAGDSYANRLQELLELIEVTPSLRRVGKVRRKFGKYRLEMYGTSLEGVCRFDPRRRVMSYNNGVLNVTHSIRRGHMQADLETFFASLNIHDVPSAAEEMTSSAIEAS